MSVELREIEAVAPDERGERCNDCSAPLAEDQRYCLNCGARTPGAGPRLVAAVPPATVSDATTAVEQRRRWVDAPLTLGLAAAATGVLLLVLIVGVLIGKSGGQDSKIAAAPPQVIRVAAPAATGTSAPAAESFTSDWPDGKKGFTVQLQTLANDSPVAAVQAAKTAAGDKGATAVGALNSDDFASLDSGQYVIYSGIYGKRADAAKALKKLKKDFPSARVVAVNDGGGASGSGSGGGKQKTVHKNQLKNLEKLSPQEYSKKSRKLPKTLKLPGKPPPKDNKKPGGGGGSETIG